VPPADVARMCAAAQAHLDGLTPHYEVEHRMLHRDGSVRWFHARGAVSARRGGKAVRMSGTEVEITERRHAEEELRVARLDLAHASRLALVGELMASIAHEIKQPLTSILTNASVGLRLLNKEARAVEGVDFREILGDVRDETRRAADIIERLRALARKRPLELAALDVNDLVNDILRLVGADAQRRGVRLRTELVPSLPAVAADRVCLQQVMLNLILNGMEAMEHAGTDDRQVIVQTRHLEKAVEVVVRDTGPGIPIDSLPTLFDAFFTTKSEGLGLGLAIARSIVDSHGGQLWADDHGGRGATFHLTLPVLASG
jgi:C4-dicarboxylate-specific signal transduction histidine kinase